MPPAPKRGGVTLGHFKRVRRSLVKVDKRSFDELLTGALLEKRHGPLRPVIVDESLRQQSNDWW